MQSSIIGPKTGYSLTGRCLKSSIPVALWPGTNGMLCSKLAATLSSGILTCAIVCPARSSQTFKSIVRIKSQSELVLDRERDALACAYLPF